MESLLLGPLFKVLLLLAVVGGLFIWIFKNLKKAGVEEQILRDVKKTVEVQKKIDSVKNASEEEIDDRLDKGTF